MHSIESVCQSSLTFCYRTTMSSITLSRHPSLHCRPAMSVVYHKLGDERGTLEDMDQTRESQLGCPLEEGRTLHPDLQSKYSGSSNERQQERKAGAVGLDQPSYLNDSTMREPLYGNI